MTTPPTDYRPLLQQALDTIEDLEAKLEAAERARAEPIAIIGIGCRFPGSADTPEAFWDLLQRGEDAVSEVPADRWDLEKFYSADPEAAGKMYARHGGFLDRVDEFEPRFFGISPREARTLDPQQRLVLEVAWEALEHAGQAPTLLRDSSTGVFVGIGGSDFMHLELERGDLKDVDAYIGSGGGLCFASGRLSYVLGLRGPSLAVDTACSSSLVALHLACQSLRQGECDLALAGGVHVILSPFVSVYLSRTRALAPDGRSKAFDAAADGFVRGEGCGMIALKRLSDAVAAGDSIIATINGSAVNQDGASSGLTVPNGPAQAAVVRAALRQAGLQPAAIGYVEAHGTGTPLGDPIEMNALCGVLREGRASSAALIVGSVKGNIGHLEAAAGIAGVIKAALSVQRGVVPPQLHFRQWNPEIDFQGTNVMLPRAPHRWDAGPDGRFAGVSSFGFSGTNSHVIIGEAPVRALDAGAGRAQHAMRVTARTPVALAALGGRIAARLAADPSLDLHDASYTANTGRAHFTHRAVVLGDSPAAMREGLESLAAGREDPRVITGKVEQAEPQVAFLFPGQGAQYAGMGRSLYDGQPVFRDAIDRCNEALLPHLDTPLIRLLYPADGGGTPIDDTRYAQPVMLAFEYALACVWQSWGIRPAALLGHSLGEYAAACVSGLLPLDDALRLVAERGRMMGSLHSDGAMTAVFASEARVRDAMAGEEGALSIAAINGPENVVISGARASVERVSGLLERAGVDVRPLNVPHAAHSALLDPVLDEFERAVSRAAFGRANIPIVSNVTGEMLTPAQGRDPGYWRRHAREAVRYADGVQTLYARGIRCFVEMGPHTTACGMAAGCLPEGAALLVPSLRKKRDDWEQMLESAAMLYVRGAAMDWDAVDDGFRKRRVHLPSYPFQRERHWPESLSREAQASSALPRTQIHPVLTGKLELADAPGSVVWEGELDLARHPYIADHQIQGIPVVPATLYLELALAAATHGRSGAGVRLRDIDFHRPLLLREGAPASMQVALARDAHGAAAVRIHSRVGTEDGWTLRATVTLDAEAPVVTTPDGLLEGLRRRCTRALSGPEFYATMAARGNTWGPSFQGMVELWQGESEALSLIEVQDSIASEVESYYLHPALADATGQVLAATLPLQAAGARGGAFVAGGIEAVQLLRRPRGRQFWAHARIRPAQPGEDQGVLIGDVTLMDSAGEVLCVSEGCRFWYLDHGGTEAVETHVATYQAEWISEPTVPTTTPLPPGPVLIFADDAGVGAIVREELAAKGTRCAIVTRSDQLVAGNDAWQVRSNVPSDYERVLAAQAGVAQPLTVLFLWGLDAVAGTSEPDKIPDRAASRSLELVYLAQAASRNPATNPVRIWAVTAGAQKLAADTGADPVQSMFWGLGRTIAAEHQELWGGLLDLEPHAAPREAAEQLLRFLSQPRDESEDQRAIRGANRFVPRLRRFELPSRAPFACDPVAGYLVTGGLGGLGWEVARWLVSRGARHLVLLGRNPLPPRDQWDTVPSTDLLRERLDQVRALEAQGVAVAYEAVDVGDREALSRFLKRYTGMGWPSIRGVVHSAGVMQYHPLAEQSAENLREVFQAKVYGAWNLHREFPDSLDFFVLFSSAASIIQSPFFGGYAAANAFLDGLAHWRRAHGATALSINWGEWTQVGLAARFVRERSQASRDGEGGFTPEEGIAAMERLMNSEVSQATVLGVEWAQWRGLHPRVAMTPFMRDLMPAAGSASPSNGSRPRDLSVTVLDAPEGGERLAAAASYVAECVGAVLGINATEIEREAAISNLGVDSMMALELKNRVARELQVVIPLVRFLDGPSVDRIALLVCDGLDARTLAAAAASAGHMAAAEPTGSWEEGEI